MTDPRQTHRHCAFFCEENVWHLAAALGPEHCQVLLITNASRQVPMWQQRAALSTEQPVLWDYHVVLLRQGSSALLVHDLDSTLPWPVPLATYLARSFDGAESWPADLQPGFRLVDAALYHERLWSDRSHMRDAQGAWVRPPPSWPAPLPGGNVWPLRELLDLDQPEPGRVLDLAQLRALAD